MSKALQKTDKLIGALVDDLRVTPWYARRRARVALWCALAVVYFIAAVSFMDRPALQFLLTAIFMIETAAIFLLAVILGAVGIVASVPGEPIPKRFVYGALSLAILAIASVVVVDPRLMVGFQQLLDHTVDARICASATVLWALPPAVVGIWLLGVGSGPRLGFSTLMVFSGAGLLGTAVLQFECMNQEPLHVLFGHMAPAVALGWLAFLVWRVVFRWARRVAALRDRLT